MMPELLTLLEKEGEEAEQWRVKLARLLHYLMYLHTGFPDLYDPILDLIKVRDANSFVCVFCNILVTGLPVKFGLLSPESARQGQDRWNRTLPTHSYLS
jgi:hypothetical protein